MRWQLPAFALALALAGCAESGPGPSDVYIPAAHYERYPIGVAKGPAKLDVSSRRGFLTPEQEDTVARFAQQAQSRMASAVHVRRPSGGGRSVAVANAVAALLKKNGIPNDMLVVSTYPGASTSPVLIAYTRKYAVTRACGNWNDLSATYDNRPYDNFGCAQQNNIAAMVADPDDFVVPRAMSPADATRRSKVFDQYREGEITSSALDQQQQVQISTVATQ